MSFHAVIAFPDDDDETLEKVLHLTRTGAISSPLARAVTFEDGRDAVMARMFGGRVIDSQTLVFEIAEEEKALQDWLVLNCHTDRYRWLSLERFEFFQPTDAQRLMQAFEAVAGHAPWFLTGGPSDSDTRL